MSGNITKANYNLRFDQVIITFSTIIILSIVLVFSGNFLENVWSPKFYAFALIILVTVFVLVSLRLSLSRPLYLPYSLPVVFFVFFFLYIFCRVLFQPVPILNNESFYKLYFLLCFFLLAAWSYDKLKPSFLYFIIFIYLIIACINIIWSGLQGFQISKNLLSDFKLGGGLGNPNILSTYLASIVVFSLGLLLTKKEDYKHTKYLKAAALCVIVLGGALIIYIQSRSAWIGILAGAFFILNYKFSWVQFFRGFLNNSIRKILFASVFLVTLICCGYFLYLLKPGSASVRMLIWNISTDMISEHSLFGVGYGSFSSEYGHYQAEYFKGKDITSQDYYLADNIEVAYNEFLQLWVETGVIGLALFVIFLFYLFKKANYKDWLSIIALSALMVILINSMFSFTIQMLPVYIQFVFYSAIICSRSKKSIWLIKKQWLLKGGGLLLLLFNLNISSRLLKIYKDEKDLKKTSELILNKDLLRAKIQLEKSAPNLKYNKFFIFLYGKVLYSTQDFKKGIEFLQQSRQYYSGHYLYMTLGDCYSGIKDFDKAIESYSTAHFIIPHLITPKFSMVKAYEKKGDIKMAIDIAKETIETKEKIPSTEVMQMKKHLQELVNYYSAKK